MKTTLMVAAALVLALPGDAQDLKIFDKLKVTGYVQAQYLQDERSRDSLDGTGSKNLDQFSIRRGRVKLTYAVTPNARVVFQPDFSSSGVSTKDLYVELTEPWTKWKNTVTAGQFTWPFGFELQYSSGVREMPERSRVVRSLFPGERDRGVMLSGRGGGDRFRYQVAVVNGTGSERSDLNQEKDIVARAGYALGPLAVGASLYEGTELVATSANAAGSEFDKQRRGFDLQWTTPVEGLTLRGEYIRGRQAPAPNSARTESHDVDGWNTYAIQSVGERHRFVARLDEYDADTEIDGNAVRTLGGAYIFQWDRHNKVTLAYEMPEHETNDPADDVLTVRYQLTF